MYRPGLSDEYQLHYLRDVTLGYEHLEFFFVQADRFQKGHLSFQPSAQLVHPWP
jgi:hypothetical protein